MRFVLILMGMTLVAHAHDYITTKVTWTREVSRILYQHCASCHRDGGTAFSLLKYDEARPWAKAIKEEVLMRRMPPWNAVKGFGEFKNDKGLTQEQLEIIAQWVEGGAPEGNPAYLPKLPREFSHSMDREIAAKAPVTGLLILKAPAVFSGIKPGPARDGGALQVIAIRPDGSTEPLLWVEAFNPAYDQPYWFRTPLAFPAGTRIEVTPRSGTALLLR
jgi:hypothetical protein